jgi:hypothetical protein
MNRTNRMNESRTARAHWLRQARIAMDTSDFARCVRKARFHHANLMAVKLADWS